MTKGLAGETDLLGSLPGLQFMERFMSKEIKLATAPVSWGVDHPYVNFKDISAELLDQVRAEGVAFLDAVDLGIFQPLGKGNVDFRSFGEALSGNGFSGPAVIEQDRKPGRCESATAAMMESLRYLSSRGSIGRRIGY